MSQADSSHSPAKEDWTSTWERILSAQPDYTFDLQSECRALLLHAHTCVQLASPCCWFCRPSAAAAAARDAVGLQPGEHAVRAQLLFVPGPATAAQHGRHDVHPRSLLQHPCEARSAAAGPGAAAAAAPRGHHGAHARPLPAPQQLLGQHSLGSSRCGSLAGLACRAAQPAGELAGYTAGVGPCTAAQLVALFERSMPA